MKKQTPYLPIASLKVVTKKDPIAPGLGQFRNEEIYHPIVTSVTRIFFSVLNCIFCNLEEIWSFALKNKLTPSFPYVPNVMAAISETVLFDFPCCCKSSHSSLAK